ncbi:MAG: hypothetical protein KF894_04500 [Labilithrix sp.]|nr:hypothetical protein [Labilithrix sp.]
MLRRRLLALLSTSLLVASARTARATPNFPDVVASHLALDAAPPCTLCHVGTPARGNVTTPFGATLRSRGAVAYDEAALRLALDALAAERKDSDGDGVPDIDELRAGDDPNGAPGAVTTPEYGCAIGRATGAAGTATAAGAALGFALALTCTRRARRRARGAAAGARAERRPALRRE